MKDLLTKRQRFLLEVMRDENEEFVYEDGFAYVGEIATSRYMLLNLLKGEADMTVTSTVEDWKAAMKAQGYEIVGSCPEYFQRLWNEALTAARHVRGE